MKGSTISNPTNCPYFMSALSYVWNVRIGILMFLNHSAVAK